jgi:hypothetical protein
MIWVFFFRPILFLLSTHLLLIINFLYWYLRYLFLLAKLWSKNTADITKASPPLKAQKGFSVSTNCFHYTSRFRSGYCFIDQRTVYLSDEGKRSFLLLCLILGSVKTSKTMIGFLEYSVLIKKSLTLIWKRIDCPIK